MIQISDDVQFDERELAERFVRSSGPGGQNVNKVSTAVELRLDLSTSSLPRALKERLRILAGNRLTGDDTLVIDSRVHRTQLQNRAAARVRLVDLLKRAAIKPKTRRATKPKAAARERRLDSKKHRSAIKTLRRGDPD